MAQLEFLETFKVWDPEKSDAIWPLAYSRITGAMKDHVRYITKSDPTRFYDWVTDAAHLYLDMKKGDSFEQKIETGVQLGAAMEVLTVRERQIVVAHTRKDHTFQMIADDMDLSESQISRIYKKAIEKIKKVVDEE